MASKLPAYILKGSTIAVGDAGNRIGQASEITIPVMAKAMEEFRNAGMVKPRMVSLGYEATEVTFTETAFDPDMLALFGVAGSTDMIAYGYLESEDGTAHSARFEMVAELTSMDPGDWTEGDKAEVSYSATVHSGVLFIDDEEILAFDDFTVRVRGKELQPERSSALRLR